MSISKLPSGKWRAQVYDPATRQNVGVGRILGGRSTFATKTAAKQARAKARDRLNATSAYSRGVTLADFHELWTTDPLFARPKESTNLHNAERTRAFVDRYGSVLVAALGTEAGDSIVAEWLAGGRRNGQVPALRAMLNDAMSTKGGRLLERNPFAGLGLSRRPSKRQPPTQEEMEALIAHARILTPPSFAAYLEFACLSGLRVGELDALRWEHVRFDDDEVDATEQWNARIRTFTEPKYGPYTAALSSRARGVLLGMKRDWVDSPFVFTTLRGTHYTPSSRTHHWNRVRCAAGLGKTKLYVATRHYWGWYALNVLELPPHVIAEQFGHRDGGRLVIETYGHPDGKVARRRIREAMDGAADVRLLRLVQEEGA